MNSSCSARIRLPWKMVDTLVRLQVAQKIRFQITTAPQQVGILGLIHLLQAVTIQHPSQQFRFAVG